MMPDYVDMIMCSLEDNRTPQERRKDKIFRTCGCLGFSLFALVVWTFAIIGVCTCVKGWF